MYYGSCCNEEEKPRPYSYADVLLTRWLPQASSGMRSRHNNTGAPKSGCMIPDHQVHGLNEELFPIRLLEPRRFWSSIDIA